MGITRTIERKAKRALIRVLTSVVKTEAMTRDEILDLAPRRVLVIRQHNQMGDMLLAVPAFRAIKEAFPAAEVGVLTAKINRGVLLNNPYVDHLLTYGAKDPFGMIGLVRNMRRRHYDLVIVLHTVSFSFTSAVLGLMSGARARVGSTSEPFGNTMSRSFYHLDLPLPTSGELAGMNEAEHNLYPLQALGIHTEDISPLLVPDDNNTAWANQFFSSHAADDRLTVTVHPGAGKTQNIWPPQKFAEVVNLLAEKVPINLFVLEGPRDARPVSEFCQLVPAPLSVVRGHSIGDVAALMQKSDLVLCNDTGVMHVSSAAGARTLAVFGPTDPVRWAPRCTNLHIVRAANGDLDGLESTAVLDKALRALGDVRGSVQGAQRDGKRD